MIRGHRRSRLIILALLIASTLILAHLYGFFSRKELHKIIGQRTSLNEFLPSFGSESDGSPEFCYDPYRLPGNVKRTEGVDSGEIDLTSLRYVVKNPHRARRINREKTSLTSDSEVPSFLAQIVEDPDQPSLGFLKDRTVIFIGDSLDRNLVFQLSTEAFGETNHQFLNSVGYPSLKEPATKSHRIGLGVHPSLNLTLTNWFLMSVNVESPKKFFHPGEDPPQNFEGRLETFYYPLVDQRIISSEPDLIVLNSGLWDLVYLNNARDYEIAQNRSAGITSPSQKTGEPLTQSELDHHEKRFRLLIENLKERFPSPKTRLVYRTMPDPAVGKADQNAMSRVRVRQIDSLNVKIVHSFNTAGKYVDIIDWAWATRDLGDELMDLVHYGRGAAQWIYGEMVLQHLRRHVLGSNQECVWIGCQAYLEELSKHPKADHHHSRSHFNLK